MERDRRLKIILKTLYAKPLYTRDLLKETKIPKPTLMRLLRDLKKAGEITQKQKGAKWYHAKFNEIEVAIESELKAFIECSETNPYNIKEEDVMDFASALGIKYTKEFEDSFWKVASRLGITIWNSKKSNLVQSEGAQE